MRKLIVLIALLIAPVLFGQGQNPTVSIYSGATAAQPTTCQPRGLNIFFNITTPSLKICTAANTFTDLVMSGGSGGWPLLAPNGTSAAPSYAFSSFPTLGLYANTNLALAQGTGSLLVTGTTDVPTALTAALVVIAGNIDAGSHSYKVTYVTAGGETSGGTVSNSVVNDGTHAQNTLSSVPVGNAFVTQRKIYRNKVADQTHWFLQQTIANNTATTGVQDNTADSGLTTAMPTTNTAIDTRLTVANSGVATFTAAPNVSAGAGTVPTFNGTALNSYTTAALNGWNCFRDNAAGTNLAQGDVMCEWRGIPMNNALYNATSAIQQVYDGSGTTRLGYISFLTSNAGSPGEQFRVHETGVTVTGTIADTAQAMTAGTMTVTNSAQVRSVVQRFDWTNAMVVALGAVTAGDIAVCTLPAKTKVLNMYVVIDTPDSSANALTVAVGRVSATYIDYIVASDAKAVANTVYGDASGERGTNLTGFDLPSVTGTTLVNAHFIKTTTNLNTVTASTGHIYIETAILP